MSQALKKRSEMQAPVPAKKKPRVSERLLLLSRTMSRESVGNQEDLLKDSEDQLRYLSEARRRANADLDHKG